MSGMCQHAKWRGVLGSIVGLAAYELIHTAEGGNTSRHRCIGVLPADPLQLSNKRIDVVRHL
jgi:hypothetical protein